MSARKKAQHGNGGGDGAVNPGGHRACLSSEGARSENYLGGAGVCFSAEMDVAAGVVVGTIGVEGLRHVRRPRELALGLLPVLLGAHQLTEAFIWWGDSGLVATSTARTAMLVYVAFAYVVLPVLVPMVVLGAEPDVSRRRMIALFAVLGVLVALLYLQAMVDGTVNAVVDGNRIAYHTGVAHGGLVAGLYMLATVGALLASTHPLIVAFGKANLVALPVLALLYSEALASLWCAWAAVTSIIIVAHLRQVASTAAPSDPRIPSSDPPDSSTPGPRMRTG